MFSDEAEPLQELLRKGNSFVWTENREKAFCSIKEKISTDCLLNMPNWNLPFTIEVDGSKVAVGATLTQQDNAGNQKVLSYHSSTMDPSQRNYSPTEQECWAAISACRKFDVYIKGAPSLTLISDHEPLQWLRKQKDPRNKFSRWIMELEQYPYEFKYRPGVEHQGPDTLSRIDTGEPSKTDDETKFEGHVYMVEMKDVKEPDEWKKLLVAEQIRDNAINIAREQLLDQGKIATGRFKSFNKLYIQDGLLVKAGRIVVPNSLKYQIVRDFHSSNHWGAANTLNDVKKSYYWPNMQKYIEEYCASCEGCLRSKHMNVKSKAPLKPINWAQYHPRQAIALDLATMAPSSEGYRYIMLIVDGMSKFVELCPLRNINAKSVTKNVKREWIGRHGAPEALLTDQGQQVDGEEINQMCEEYGIKKKRSSPYHPEGDGISERPIGVMKGLFRGQLIERKLPQRQWPELVPDVQLAMNTKKHASTKLSPYELMYGTEYKSPGIHNLIGDKLSPECSTKALAEEIRYNVNGNTKIARENLETNAIKMKRYYDTKTKEDELHIGDLVSQKKN